ncbi:MAG: FAD-dependent oxidoreductase, partial [Desulfobacula sp.]
MESKNNVIIVGGGVIGLACAHYLLKENASVRIIEKDFIGSGASYGNCGLLHFSGILPLCAPGVVRHEIYRAICGTSPLYIKPGLDMNRFLWLMKFASHCSSTHMNHAARAKYNLLKYSKDLYDEFFKETPMSCDFEKKGVLLLFRDSRHFEKYAATNAQLKQYNFEALPLDAKEARSLEPSIREDVVGAYYNEHDDHIRPEMLIQSWKKYLIGKGLIIEEKCAVKEFESDQNNITAVQTIKGRYQADHFIVSTGAFTPQLNKQLKLPIPIQPGKGYSITMEKPDRSCEIPCLLYERNMVVTPWQSGYRLGGTMEFSGFDASLNKKRLAKLLKGA